MIERLMACAVALVLLQPGPAVVITGARIVDGTGTPPRTASVRIEGDRDEKYPEPEKMT